MSVSNMIKEDIKTNEFWSGVAKLEFSIFLNKTMKEKGISKSELARIIGKTPAYITKVMSGDANLTIESMVMFSRAIGMKFSPTIVEDVTTRSSSNVVSIAYRPQAKSGFAKVYCHG